MGDVAAAKVRVLVVDDDPDLLELVRRTLTPHFEVQTHNSALGVSNLVRNGEPDLVLLDVNFPALKGDQVLALARRYAPRTRSSSSTRRRTSPSCARSRGPPAPMATSPRASGRRAHPEAHRLPRQGPHRPRLSAPRAARN